MATFRAGAAAGLLVTAIGIAACGGASDQAAEADANRSLTFTRDVAPIVFGNCVTCHRPGEAAPFSLTTYQDVRQRASTIVDVTSRRYMPPWLPVAGHGEFAGERRLGDAQIQTIARWVEQGAVEGDPADLPPLPALQEGWRLGEPDLVVPLPGTYTLRADGGDVWRNFVLPVPLDSGRYVKTVEIHPGSARFVHHALLGVDETTASRRRDAQDQEPGFDGMDMGDAASPSGHLLGWTPGMVPFPGVSGKPWRLEPGTDFVLQAHLLPSGKPEEVKPVVGIYFDEAPPTGPPLALIRLDADHLLDIPPGDSNFVVTDEFKLPVDIEVLAVYPHAHFLATAVEGQVRLPDGSERSLIRIDSWDFKWQDVYRFAKPVSLPRGSTITMRWVFDNSANNPRNPQNPPQRVVAGPRSFDEMAHLQLQVLPRSTDDAILLREAMNRYAIAKFPEDPWPRYELGNALRERGLRAEAIREYRAAIARDANHASSHNNLALVLMEMGQIAEAISHYQRAVDAEPGFVDAHFNLANALRSENRLGEAGVHYRHALRLEPDFAPAHNNLGEVLAAEGRMSDAIASFERAVRLRPDSAQSHNNLGAALGQMGRLKEAVEHFRQALQVDPSHAGARENLSLAMEALAAGGP
jgi:tetratricopeptide (TPR) repeat protein/mono/diheme cytochrome c family protein